MPLSPWQNIRFVTWEPKNPSEWLFEPAVKTNLYLEPFARMLIATGDYRRTNGPEILAWFEKKEKETEKLGTQFSYLGDLIDYILMNQRP